VVPGLKMGGDLRRGCRTAAAPGVKGPCSCTTIGRKAEWLWLLRLSSQPPPLRHFDPRGPASPMAPHCSEQRRAPAEPSDAIRRGPKPPSTPRPGTGTGTRRGGAHFRGLSCPERPILRLIFAQVSTVQFRRKQNRRSLTGLQPSRSMLQPNSQHVIIKSFCTL